MMKPHRELMVDNPLSKIPTLVLDNGTVLYDSAVICEYLDHLHDGQKLFPLSFEARMTALRRQALGDGLLDALVLWRGELSRPAEQQSQPYLKSFSVRNEATLAALEREAPALESSAYSIGHVAIGCALCYLDFRFGDRQWRRDHPQLARWHATFCSPGVQRQPGRRRLSRVADHGRAVDHGLELSERHVPRQIFHSAIRRDDNALDRHICHRAADSLRDSRRVSTFMS